MSEFKYWIVVVDDDVANLMTAGNVMSKNGMRVTALKSGKALLDYIETNGVPDLCLLDIKMPDMDGFETLEALRASRNVKELPVVFLTADESQTAEAKGLSLGAMDFIKKPFVPEVLVLRARHIIDLVRLQKNLTHEVEVKTKESYRLFIRVVSALTAAVDAKDINGHSERVAKYSREIAKRHGYNDDGTGYPDGLAGEKIPEQARIIAVADRYDTMKARGELSRNELRKGRGTQFDSRFVDIMLRVIDENV